jgi:protein-S-isoprenylcysteine O-methyltransferase Ste14
MTEQQKKIVSWSAAICALLGAWGVRRSGLVPTHAVAFGLAKTPLGRAQLLAALIPWVIFSLYWEIAAKNVAPAKKSESAASRGVHVVLTNLALLLEIVQFSWLARFLTVSVWTIAAGGAVEAIGLFVAIWARRYLGRNWSGEITIKVEHELIKSGPYRRLRHPIYTGLLTMYAGTALITGTWFAIVGFLLAAFAYWRKIRLEEANMRVAFGAAYDSYCGETWALVPGLF